MKYELTTPRVTSPITVDNAKLHLNIEHTDDDSWLPTYIDQATSWAENYTGASVGSQVWTLYGDTWCDILELPALSPITAVVVKYDDPDGVEQTLHPDEYWFDGKSKPATITPSDTSTDWPETSTGPNVIRVEMTVGQVTVQPDFLAGIYMMIGHLYERREATSPIDIKEVPLGAKAFLDHYKVYSP